MSEKRLTIDSFSTPQKTMIFFLRVLIGWHFLYEGIVKLMIPNWSAIDFLAMSRWILAPLYNWIAATPSVLAVVDFLNIWGLIFIGLGLIFGFMTRIAMGAGVALLALYYTANPPLVGLDYGVPVEGHYLWVNKTLIEMVAMLALFFLPTHEIYSLDGLIKYLKKMQPRPVSNPDTGKPGVQAKDSVSVRRRQILLGLASLPVVGAFAIAFTRMKRWQSYEEKNLVDAETSASTKLLDVAQLKELEGLKMPMAKIRNVDFSRLILGGNLLSGYSHSRDLIYVSQLVKAYHNKDKIFATLMMAEKCGVNTLLTNPILATMIDEYWKRGLGKIQFISDCAGLEYDKWPEIYPTPFDQYLDRVKRAIDYGATACYIQGETADFYMNQGQADRIAKTIQLIRDHNLPVGIGAHHINTVKACVDAGFDPDFWMKTLHHHHYWSASAPTWNDNMYCFDPQETIAYMKELPQPWIAFKVMAAGAIQPQEAFKYAFENGADFVCAGMYDFQMVEDVKIAINTLNSDLDRERKWMA